MRYGAQRSAHPWYQHKCRAGTYQKQPKWRDVYEYIHKEDIDKPKRLLTMCCHLAIMHYNNHAQFIQSRRYLDSEAARTISGQV